MADIRTLLQKCKALAKTRKAAECNGYLSTFALNVSTTMFSDHMTQLYFKHFESAFRILHISSFWSEYEEYWRKSPGTSDLLQLRIQLVVAIGSSLRQEAPDSPTSFRSTATQWVHEAQHWLVTTRAKNRVSIGGLQLHCLLALACQCLAIAGDLVYIDLGHTIRTAIQMGLHRDPKHYKKISTL